MPHPILFYVFCALVIVAVLGAAWRANKGNLAGLIYSLLIAAAWALAAAWAYGWPWFGLIG